MKALKCVLAIVIFPLVFVLRVICWTANKLINLSAYVLGPLMYFVLGCLIYCLVKARWMDVALLVGIEATLWVISLGAISVICAVENLCDGMMAFVRS